jgi:hypothetical protein
VQVQLEDEENYVLNTSIFYQFLQDDFLTDCTFMVGPSGQIEVFFILFLKYILRNIY